MSQIARKWLASPSQLTRGLHSVFGTTSSFLKPSGQTSTLLDSKESALPVAPLTATTLLQPAGGEQAEFQLLAVPKKKTSKARKKMRNAPKQLKFIEAAMICRICGITKLPARRTNLIEVLNLTNNDSCCVARNN
ncbi:hypothetical protein CYMTET_46625 [Cymbomonas tetramitiformis]|uniref:Large ribosomal subunit protein bL32m n=1 Tax=Cymbomonas tetramitiformis TaxID=36881 RepID=A0AAE0BX05_9CHLO|nr:hypothetical protein CYMTET_46625 [Cymbomonas tetramitiformis]